MSAIPTVDILNLLATEISKKTGVTFKEATQDIINLKWSDNYFEFLTQVEGYAKDHEITSWSNNDKIQLLQRRKERRRVSISGRTNTQIAQAISEIIKDVAEPRLFYRPRLNDIVEVREYYDKKTKQTFQAIIPTDSKRVGMILDEIIEFYITIVGKFGQTEQQKSPTDNLIQHIMVSDSFTSALPILDRLLTFPLPFVVNGKLHLPCHGHDERFDTYTLKDCPIVTVMEKDAALAIIDKILAGFCFENDRDKNMARAFIITPMARGFYPRMTCRTPVWLIKANRERSGKDYLAGVAGIIYEGQHRDSAPISTGHEQDNQELRKTITSTLMLGGNRFHSANNRGRLDNAVLEQATTSEHITDRVLGKSALVNLDNTLEFSLSANVGLTYTADFFYRCRIINLFFSEEDANAREFPIPDLHGYVKEHRAEIVSAIYSLYYHWFNAGAPSGKTPFTSFPEWARVVGGVFDFCGLESPCVHIEADNVGGDIETENMKQLFAYMADKHSGEPYAISGITAIIQRSEEEIFNHLDFSQRKDQTRFAILIRKFVGRILGGVKMTLRDPSQKRTVRQMFVFTRKVATLATFGYLSPSAIQNDQNSYILSKRDQRCPGSQLPSVLEELKEHLIVPKNEDSAQSPEDCIRAICLAKGRIEYPHEEYHATQERMLLKGVLCHDEPGYVRLLE